MGQSWQENCNNNERGVGQLGIPSGTWQNQNHRTRERPGLEGTLNTISFQPPCHVQGQLPLTQTAQSPIQPGLEHFQPQLLWAKEADRMGSLLAFFS